MGNVSVGAQSPNPVVAGNSATYTINVDHGGQCHHRGSAARYQSCSALWSYGLILDGGTCRVSNNADWTSTLTLATTNGAPLGTTSFTVRGRAFASTTCSGSPLPGGSGTATAAGTLVVSGGSWVRRRRFGRRRQQRYDNRQRSRDVYTRRHRSRQRGLVTRWRNRQSALPQSVIRETTT